MKVSRSTALAKTLRGACRARCGTPATTIAVSRRSIATTSGGFVTQQQQQPNHPPQRQLLASRPATTQTRHYASAPASKEENLDITPLHPLHLAHNAKLVPFGGFSMPVQYPSHTVSQSHVFTRAHASLFDVSHMVQRRFTGPGATAFLERVTPSGIGALEPHRSTLSVLLKADGSGGIVDDTVITRLGGGEEKPYYYVVTNAGCREKDDAYLSEEVQKWNQEFAGQGLEVVEERWHNTGLLALQGPEAETALSSILAADDQGSVPDLHKLFFGQSVFANLKLPNGSVTTKPVLISRGGYTGEDGFEISIPATDTVAVAEALLAAGGADNKQVQLAGLGARDSLRLEAGMCLYGHDLDETTTPVEAGLSWIIPKDRRSADAGYYGAELIAKQLVPKTKGGAGIDRRRVGLVVEGAPAREGADIATKVEGGGTRKIGVVTSGCPSPSVGKNIAMGYVEDGFHKAGTAVQVVVRGRPRIATVTKMPFIETKYYKGA
ncbi:uncharacterized protein C8A04DRAFT_27606 [Dichotomopilus funicola]|uniref:Aminomethyltransferase n=1 Tax=Dichotomopilus funicola TaxID=1934379 RepID=A0AAN6ZNY6_9PEZI|nr:hypothetical protein C8A04DRAFT_27606 [Dichotomopilus funicola]